MPTNQNKMLTRRHGMCPRGRYQPKKMFTPKGLSARRVYGAEDVRKADYYVFNIYTTFIYYFWVVFDPLCIYGLSYKHL